MSCYIDYYQTASVYFKSVGLVYNRCIINRARGAKFGPKRNHNWPLKSYQVFIRAGPQFVSYNLFLI